MAADEPRPRRRHRRRTLAYWGAGVVVLLVVAAFVGPAVYAALVNRHADPAPTLSAGASVGAAGPLADGRWTVGTGSFAGYRVHEVLQGHGATVTGRTDRVSGQVTVSGGRVTAGTVTVQVGSIHTDEPPRDAYFRSTALETSKFPTATFTLTSPVPATSGSPTLPGRLTVHGVTRDVRVPAQAATGRAGADLVASLPVTWADYGVSAPRLPFVTVDDHGAIELELHLVRAS
ncbi:YceI family protein [Luteimicrobium sp. NPDC057192]|uniref:YceI family protein n=1 Tax=Luteimicrobium sp. NPDC057192 TaxID=3346042 RepID=UPI00363138C9